jgi:hypothetical protein
VTAIIGMLFLIGILFVALVSIKPKPKTVPQVQPIQSVVHPSPAAPPAPQVSYREQQINEFAVLMATEYARMKDEEQRSLARESLQIADAYRQISEQQRAESIHAKAVAAFAAKS